MVNKLLSLSLLLIPACVYSMPYIVLRNKAAKCVKIEDIKPQSTLLIHYHTPDVVMDSDTPMAGEDEESQRYADRQRQRMEMMKTSRMKDINVLVQQRQDDYFKNRPDPMKQNIQPRPPTNKMRVQLEDREGVLRFATKDGENSLVELCVQSYFATQEDPSRVGLNLTVVMEDDPVDDEPSFVMTVEQTERILKQNRVIKSQTSGITKELLKLEKKVVDVKRDVGRSSRQANAFQRKTESLNDAVYYWPIFRIIVLLVGGVLQVSHVLNYMKKRHIY